ncbi:hypothetical protein B0T19DRAFT_170978 [Cercophora scortea]|uniref:Uncharacterized protein n=1 Tax=Cercophora scortea TaxID=314031 RepID=A0AAE0ME34_9PEZI|nr:hypothetical protein B0T19DRAFT_170978 [Cercophora scortea]
MDEILPQGSSRRLLALAGRQSTQPPPPHAPPPHPRFGEMDHRHNLHNPHICPARKSRSARGTKTMRVPMTVPRLQGSEKDSLHVVPQVPLISVAALVVQEGWVRILIDGLASGLSESFGRPRCFMSTPNSDALPCVCAFTTIKARSGQGQVRSGQVGQGQVTPGYRCAGRAGQARIPSSLLVSTVVYGVRALQRHKPASKRLSFPARNTKPTTASFTTPLCRCRCSSRMELAAFHELLLHGTLKAGARFSLLDQVDKEVTHSPNYLVPT